MIRTAFSQSAGSALCSRRISGGVSATADRGSAQLESSSRSNSTILGIGTLLDSAHLHPVQPGTFLRIEQADAVVPPVGMATGSGTARRAGDRRTFQPGGAADRPAVARPPVA